MPKVGRKYTGNNSSYVQSIRFDCDQWTEAEARKWCESNKVDGHDVFTDGLDTTDNEYRFRQYDPNDAEFRYRSGRVVKGMYMIFGFRKD